MQTVGNITGYIDLAQIMLYVFWIFFAGLIWYLVAEGHREGYPMESSSSGHAVTHRSKSLRALNLNRRGEVPYKWLIRNDCV